MPLSQLVEALHIHKQKMRHLQRLMGILIHSGIFLEIPEGYILTPASHLLLKENPLSVTPFLLSMLNPGLTDPWHQLSNWFKIEETATPFEDFHGSSFWDLAGQEPQLNYHFNEGMAADARLVSSLVVRECKDVFEGVNSLVDVGGGTGTMAKAIADAFPDLSCVVLDLPHVVDGLQGSSNLSFVAGDMFESVPPVDAILLKFDS
ncbi:methyltransferase [Lithospermum erythrorhizon]|uniref:Methyltransferase n=1 Tax=Lithospermum erythrorhizon TaxID=34254 RepID=A0AAV3RI68_LITER